MNPASTEPAVVVEPRSEAERIQCLGLGALLVIFLVALAVRLAHGHVAASQGLLDGVLLDSRWYADRAADIRLGRDAGNAPYLLSPLYPYVLSPFVDAQGALDTAGVRVLQAIAGALGALLAAFLSSALGGRAAGWIAGGAAAVFGPSIHYGALVLTPALQALLLLVGVALATLERPRGRPRLAWCLSGIALGLASALHPTSLFAALGLVIALVWRSRAWRDVVSRRAVFVRAGALAVGLLLAIAPFTIRNIVVCGEPVLLSANAGMNFWIGNGAGADGVFHAPDGYDASGDPVGRDIAAKALGHVPSWRESSSWWTRRTLADIGAAPADWFGVLGRKLLLFFHSHEIRQMGEGFDWFAERSWPLRAPLDARVILLLALFAPFARRGVGLAAPDEPRGDASVASSLALPLGALLVFALGVCAFFVTGRYRAPILPVAIVLAAIGTVETWRLVTRGAVFHSRAVLLSVVALAALFAGSQWLYSGPLSFESSAGVENRNLGMALAQQGRHAEAVTQYEQSLRLRDDPITRSNLALSLRQIGRVDEALVQMRLAVKLDPSQADAWFNLGLMLVRDKSDWAGAEEGFRRAIELQPRHAMAHYQLGIAHMRKNELDAAEREFRLALELAPPQAAWRPGVEANLQAVRETRAAPAKAR